jgi:hypothetical protein
MLRFVLLSIAISLPLFTSSDSASIAKPGSGAMFESNLDVVEQIRLSNTNGCEFDSKY